MNTKFKITDHALDRFYERFGHVDKPIESLLENSFCFGGQRGLEYLLLNEEYDVVFPIIRSDGTHIVKTVLTLNQAKANLSFKSKVIFEPEFRKITPEEDIKDLNKQSDTEKEENNNKLKELAKEHLEKYGYCPGIQEMKEIRKKLKATLPVSHKQIDKFFLYEITRMIREKNIMTKPNYSKPNYYDGYILS